MSLAKTVGDEGQQIGSGDTGKGSKEECWVDWRGLSWTPVETNGEGKTKQKQKDFFFLYNEVSETCPDATQTAGQQARQQHQQKSCGTPHKSGPFSQEDFIS